VDPLRNPFSPGAGSPPPELVGRDPLLEQARVLLGRVRIGRAEKSMLLTGLRGVGKTVLLGAVQRLAVAAGFHVLFIEAPEERPLGVLLAGQLRPLLYELDRKAGRGEKAKRALRVLRSFIGGLKITAGDLTLGLDIDPETGAADSGDIEFDLPNLFAAVGEAAQDRGTGVAVLFDEVQYFSPRELAALIMAMHRLQQRQLPVVLLGAGLPILPALAGDAKSYAERLFSFPQIGALSEADTARALQEPAREQGVAFTSGALAEVYRLTRGYPYFLQEWGYQAWNLAERSPIGPAVIDRATPVVVERLDASFFRVRYDRLTPNEKRVLRAMAELGPGPYRTGDVAAALGQKVTSLSPVRTRLIRKGMIYSPAYGDIAFTVPLFDEFMKRAMNVER
jgi:hypothetical protein